MRDEHQETIGRAISRLREQQGWSQRQLAKWVGLDQSAVSRIEAGRRRVSAKELQRFADAFHVSADALLLEMPGAGDAAGPPPASSLPAPLPAAFAENRRSPSGPAASSQRLELRLDSPAEGPARAHGDLAWETDTSALRSDVSLEAPLSASARGFTPQRTSAPGRGEDIPPAVAAVIGDWFDLRRLAGAAEPALSWATGHSAEGKPARSARTVQPLERGSMGDVLHDRVARFWRSELHVEPDEGPLPDLVPLLEDGLGAQVVIARVAGPDSSGRRPTEPDAAPATAAQAAEQPVCACLTADGVPFLFVNAARPVALQRFALAHALAHVVLGHGDIVDQRIEWSRHNPREAAANDFTEEFLAPVRAVQRWYERHGDPRADLDTLLALGNAFGISAWSALYRSRAAGRLHPKQFAALRHEMQRHEWELLPRQAFLGGVRDTLASLTPGEVLAVGAYGPPAVLRVPATMRAWALRAVRAGHVSLESAAGLLRLDARALAAQLARLGLE